MTEQLSWTETHSQSSALNHYSLIQEFISKTKEKILLRTKVPGGSDGKRICLQYGRPRFDHWVCKIPWGREWQPTPVFLPGESHGQRSLADYSPWGHKDLDTTEHVLRAQCTIYRNSISLTQNSVFENFTLREKYKTSMQRYVQQKGHHIPMTAPPLKTETA